jgi:RimJ/RimL family protein N-acetyltransferase
VRHVIESPRLRLISLGADVLRASVDGDLQTAARLLGATVPPEWEEMRDVLRIRIDQVERTPADEPWLTRAAALKETGEIIGAVGFHGPPGGDWLHDYAPGGVEFGYTVFPAHRRRGYATEASTALIEWAHDEHDVRGFILSIAPANEPSARLATKLGFRHIDDWTHPSRGLEHVYRLP